MHIRLVRHCNLSERPCYVSNILRIELAHALPWPSVANAHAALARLYALKSCTCHYAALANTANRCASAWPTVANAHAVLARFYALKSPMHQSAALAKLTNNVPMNFALPPHAAPYTMLASCRAPISPAPAACTVCCTSGSNASSFLYSQHRSVDCLVSWPSKIQQADKWM